MAPAAESFLRDTFAFGLLGCNNSKLFGDAGICCSLSTSACTQKGTNSHSQEFYCHDKIHLYAALPTHELVATTYWSILSTGQQLHGRSRPYNGRYNGYHCCATRITKTCLFVMLVMLLLLTVPSHLLLFHLLLLVVLLLQLLLVFHHLQARNHNSRREHIQACLQRTAL